ncbi:hypothetical protein Tco_0249404, partial [Tanacetum coccineum]
MSLDLSATMAKVAAMSDFAFRKRFRSSYESLPSSSPPNIPLWKHYRGTYELVEDDKEGDGEEEDEEMEDKEMEECSDSNSVSKDAEDEGPTIEDEDPVVGDQGLAAGDKGLGIGVESYGSDDESHGLDDEGHSIESNGLGLEEEEEAEPEGQQRAVLFVGAVVSAPLGLG